MGEFAAWWYGVLSQASQGLIYRIDALAEEVNLPLVSAFLFGLIGATSPCQLSTNLSALAYVSRQAEGGRGLTAAAAYALGKVAVYTAVGAIIISLGLQLQNMAIPVVVTARKALGPLMVVVGLVMLGWLTLRARFGQRLAARLAGRLPTAGLGGAFLLGVVFSLAFCPTLFWLFFGLTIPLALQATAGWTFPGLFALGTVVPLLGAAAALSAGFGVAEALGGRMGRVQRVVGKVAGAVFILAGVNDTLTYWFL